MTIIHAALRSATITLMYISTPRAVCGGKKAWKASEATDRVEVTVPLIVLDGKTQNTWLAARGTQRPTTATTTRATMIETEACTLVGPVSHFSRTASHPGCETAPSAKLSKDNVLLTAMARQSAATQEAPGLGPP